MSWSSGDKLSVARLKRLSETVPSNYTVYKDGTTIYAETNISGGTNYSGTDAASVIQNAVDALPTTGGCIFVKRGVYTVNSLVTVPAATQGCWIIGEGNGSTGTNEEGTWFKLAANVEDAVFKAVGTSTASRMHGLRLAHFAIKGSNTYGTNTRAIWVENQAQFLIEDVRISGVAGVGIYEAANDWGTIKECIVSSVGDDGIQSSSSSYTNLLHNNLDACNGGTRGDAGLRLASSAHCKVHGNRVGATKRHGISVYGGDNWIAGNTVLTVSTETNNTWDAMLLGAGAINNLFEGNVLLQDDSQANKGRYGVNVSVSGATPNYFIGGSIGETGTRGGLTFVAFTTAPMNIVPTSGIFTWGIRNFNPQAVATISPGASPYTYTNQDGYPETVQVVGGTVSDISIVRSAVTTSLGVTSGMFLLHPDDGLKVTYTGVPTMRKIPC